MHLNTMLSSFFVSLSGQQADLVILDVITLSCKGYALAKQYADTAGVPQYLQQNHLVPKKPQRRTRLFLIHALSGRSHIGERRLCEDRRQPFLRNRFQVPECGLSRPVRKILKMAASL